MKKVVIILLMSVILFIASFMLYTEYDKYNKVKEENKDLVTEISNLKSDIETKTTDNLNKETKIKTLEEEKKAELKEQNIWIRLKEKLSQALS